MIERDTISDDKVNKEEEIAPKKNQTGSDYYSLLSDKLLYLIKFRDRLLIFTTIITLTILSLSIPTDNIYAPVLVSLVAFIFFIKWCNIKKEITKLSAYLRVFYEQPMKSGEGCRWESDCLQYNKKYNTLCRFENFCLYLSWIILAIIPFLVSLGIFLLDKTDGKPGINDFARAFMDGINISLVLVGILTIIGILFVLQTGFFSKEKYWHISLIARKHIGGLIFIVLVISILILCFMSPFCRLTLNSVINSPSVLVVVVVELIFTIVMVICVIKLGRSLLNTEKFDDQWKHLWEKTNPEINTPKQEGAN